MVCGGTRGCADWGWRLCRGARHRRAQPRSARASRPWTGARRFCDGRRRWHPVLEEFKHARVRGRGSMAKLSATDVIDAFHLTAPSEDGKGAFRSMRKCPEARGPAAGQDRLHQRARQPPHAQRRDRLGAVKRPIRSLQGSIDVSTKSAIGHLLVPRGVSSDLSILAIPLGGAADLEPRQSVASCDTSLVPQQSKERSVRTCYQFLRLRGPTRR